MVIIKIYRHAVGRVSLIIGLLVILAACNLTGAPVPTEIPPTPDLPRVEFIFPENNATVFEGTDLTVDLVARDETQGVATIVFFVDGNEVQTGDQPDGGIDVFRVNMNWVAEGVGVHSLSAIAYRPDGTPSDETTILVEVVARTP